MSRTIEEVTASFERFCLVVGLEVLGGDQFGDCWRDYGGDGPQTRIRSNIHYAEQFAETGDACHVTDISM